MDKVDLIITKLRINEIDEYEPLKKFFINVIHLLYIEII